MGAKWILAILAATLLLLGCGDNATGDPSSPNSPTAGPLDCGHGRKGAKGAVRQFFAVLQTGDEEKVLDALATGGRFEWLSVGDKDGDPVVATHRNRRRASAAAVADYGGLPLRVSEFFNIDRPSTTMDFGFEGRWGQRRAVGKGAIDCAQGRARVLSVALRFNVKAQ